MFSRGTESEVTNLVTSSFRHLSIASKPSSAIRLRLRLSTAIRRALLRRFPYCIFYVVSEQEIVALACLHGHRDPETWKSRRDA